MSDVWIYSESREGAEDIAAALAELGFSPRHLDARRSLVPSGSDGASVRRPTLAVVVAGEGERPGEVIGRLQSSEELAEVAVLLAVDEEHLGSCSNVGGARELLVRPFGLAELEARVTRAIGETEARGADALLRFGALEINTATYQVSVHGRPVGFTYMEYELLRFLVTHPNRVFAREALLKSVWRYDYYGGARTVDVHVRRIRAKLGGDLAVCMKTIRNVGYLFEPPAAQNGGVGRRAA
jgi:DNA-binding response OmpR family regulator